MLENFMNLTPREELVARMQAFTRRNFRDAPPTDKETMADLGISKTNLDTFLRPYVNLRFPLPREQGAPYVPLYDREKLGSSETYKALCDKCRV